MKKACFAGNPEQWNGKKETEKRSSFSLFAKVSSIPVRRIDSFTLIELLIVISVIAILAGLLLPALSKAREKAKDAACMSQIKQFCAASMMYSDEANGWFPTNGERDDAPPRMDRDDKWHGFALLYFTGYIRDKSLYYCPASVCYQLNDSTYGFGRQTFGQYSASMCYSSYFYMANFFSSDGGTPYSFRNQVMARGPLLGWRSRTAGTAAKKLKPSEDPLLADAIWSSDMTRATFRRSSHMSGAKPRGLNIGYIDGHVAWSTFSKMICRLRWVGQYYWY